MSKLDTFILQDFIQLMYRQEQPVYNHQFTARGNIIFQQNELSKSGIPSSKTFQCSDEILSEFGSYCALLKLVSINEISIMRKDLDIPLGMFKWLMSKMVNIKDEHQFLLMQTDKFLLTIDFYTENRLVIRIGTRQFVLQEKKSEARKNSQVFREKSGLQWRRIIRKNQQLTVGDVLQYLKAAQMQDYQILFNNGSHFSQNLFAVLQQQIIKKA